MKKTIITIVFAVSSAVYFAQAPDLEILPVYNRPLTQSVLDNASSLSDLINGYPQNWISTYQSVTISVKANGATLTANSKNHLLTDEQKKIIHNAAINSEIVVDVHYSYNNPSTLKTEHNKIHTSITVVPERNAQYTGGFQKFISDLKEAGVNNVLTEANKSANAKVLFSVDESGKITEVKIKKASGNQNIDLLLISVLNKMNGWSPAVDQNGNKVKQTFQLNFGREGC